GTLALAGGAMPEAERHFRLGLQIYRRYPQPFGEAEAWLLWGRGLRTAGDIASATEKLRAAQEIYRGHDAGTVWLERRAGVQPVVESLVLAMPYGHVLADTGGMVATIEHRPVAAAEVGRFKDVLRGDLLTPCDSGYDDARRVWNYMIDKHPALIVRCATESDV